MNDTKIPLNEEHLEAKRLEDQRRVDEARQQKKASMPPEDRARLEAIERAVSELEGAKVRYVLLADDSDPNIYAEPHAEKYNGWIFYKPGYDVITNEKIFQNHTGWLWGMLLHFLRMVSGSFLAGTFGYFRRDGTPSLYIQGGQMITPPPPPSFSDNESGS